VSYYKYKPQAVLEMKSNKPYYNRSIITDKAVEANRPNMMLWDKEKWNVFIIDVAVPNTHYIIKTIAEK